MTSNDLERNFLKSMTWINLIWPKFRELLENFQIWPQKLTFFSKFLTSNDMKVSSQVSFENACHKLKLVFPLFPDFANLCMRYTLYYISFGPNFPPTHFRSKFLNCKKALCETIKNCSLENLICCGKVFVNFRNFSVHITKIHRNLEDDIRYTV